MRYDVGRFRRPMRRGVMEQMVSLISLGDGSTLTLDFTTGVLDSRLTFTRASDATFINSSGLVQYADANYFARSETFDGSPWSLNGVSQTAAAVTNPVGGNSSRLIEVTASGGSKSLIAGMAVSAGFQYTFRIWVRAGASSSVSIGYYSGTAFLNITMTKVSGPGTVSGGTGSAPQLITGLTSDWTQLQIVMATLATAVSGSWFIYPNGTSNAVGNSVYLWGAQANIGATANPYYSTTTAAYFAPRFDYDPTTLAPRGLLVEGQATNLARRSDDFNTTVTDGTQWVAAGYTAGTLSTTLPDGTTGNARRISIASGSGSFRSADITVTASTAYTFSFWARNNGGSQARFRVWNVTAGSSIVDYTQSVNNYVSQIGGANNTSSTWVRVSVQFTTPAGCTAIYVYPTSSDAGTVDLLIWGAQVEAGSGASSYIPTGASTATRVQDSLSCVSPNFAPWYQAATGTLLTDVTYTALSGNQSGIQFADATGVNETNRLAIRRNIAIATRAGVTSAQFSPTATGRAISAFAYANADYKFSQNGASFSLVAGGTGNVPQNIDRLVAFTPGPEVPYGWVRRIKFWPTALPQATLNSITTL